MNEKHIEDTLAQLLKIVGETNAMVVRHGEQLSMFEQRLDTVDQRLDGIDQRLDGIDQRLDRIDQRLDGIDQRFEGLERRLDGFAIDVGRRFDERSLSIRVLGRRQDKMAGRIDALEALVEESQATRP